METTFRVSLKQLKEEEEKRRRKKERKS